MIYFYSHNYLRDRQLDTIRYWSSDQVYNAEIANNRKGAQVSKENSLKSKSNFSWKQTLPLINIKLRPKDAPANAVIYVWGGMIASGKFIVDIDNPWSLVGYNLQAMTLYKSVIRRILLSKRCVEIRCLSNACRISLKIVLGEAVFNKSYVVYPTNGISPFERSFVQESETTRLLFIGSQFEIKGGHALLAAYQSAIQINPNLSLTIITHLPEEYQKIVEGISSIKVYSPIFKREELFLKFMAHSDVLVHPSYMESFGMTILEALAHGLPVISNDIYAISEMVEDGKTGFLLNAPITKWDKYLPNKNFTKKLNYIQQIKIIDKSSYVKELVESILKLSTNNKLRRSMSLEAISRFKKMTYSQQHD